MYKDRRASVRALTTVTITVITGTFICSGACPCHAWRRHHAAVDACITYTTRSSHADSQYSVYDLLYSDVAKVKLLRPINVFKYKNVHNLTRLK